MQGTSRGLNEEESFQPLLLDDDTESNVDNFVNKYKLSPYVFNILF